MTVINTTVKQTSIGNGANVTFGIPFAFIPNEASAVTKVVLIDTLTIDTSTESGFDETLQAEGPDYALDPAGPTPANVIMVVAPTATEELRVYRDTPDTQQSDLNSGGPNTPYPPLTVEDQLDRETMKNQENKARIALLEAAVNPAVPVSAITKIPDWTAATNYLIDQSVIDTLSQKMYRAVTDHLSSGLFNTDLVNGDWELVETSGIQGAQGVPGVQGIQGNAGNNGNNGNDGNDGNDGIFASIASKAEAELGADNAKGMTPLRTKESIDFNVPLSPYAVDRTARIVVLETSDVAQNNRLTALETAGGLVGRFSGSQKLKNNSGPQELLGLAAPIAGEGKGDKFLRDGDGTEYAEVMVYIKRKNDLTTRFSSFVITMQYIDALWYIGRKETSELDDSLDLDGVILTIATNGGTKEGTVSYTTDDMPGDDNDHFDMSVIKWLGQEIPIGV